MHTAQEKKKKKKVGGARLKEVLFIQSNWTIVNLLLLYHDRTLLSRTPLYFSVSTEEDAPQHTSC